MTIEREHNHKQIVRGAVAIAIEDREKKPRFSFFAGYGRYVKPRMRPDSAQIRAHDPTHVLTEISRETSDQLKFIPATVEIVRHIRPTYACPTCTEGAHIAPTPNSPVPQSIATPSLLAQVATSKIEGAETRAC